MPTLLRKNSYGTIVSNSLTLEQALDINNFAIYIKSFDDDEIVATDLESPWGCVIAQYLKSVLRTCSVEIYTDHIMINGDRWHLTKYLNIISRDTYRAYRDNKLSAAITKADLAKFCTSRRSIVLYRIFNS